MEVTALIDAYEHAVSEHGEDSPSARLLAGLIREAVS